MNEVNTARLEELQRKAANREATAEEQHEMWELTNKVAEDRGMPTSEAGVINDKDKDGKDDDRNKPSERGNRSQPRRSAAGAGVTTTRNI